MIGEGQYKDEFGTTPEEWLMQAITMLGEKSGDRRLSGAMARSHTIPADISRLPASSRTRIGAATIGRRACTGAIRPLALAALGRGLR